MTTPLLTVMTWKGVGAEGPVPTVWKSSKVRSSQRIITWLPGQDFVVNIISWISFYQEVA